MRKRYLLVLLLFILTLGGCKGKAEEVAGELPPEETPVAEPEPTPEPPAEILPEQEDLSNKRPSTLTGEYIDMDVAARRPIAVVINNMKKSLPQSGISQAGIIYEVLAEGDITRLIAVFDEFDSEKIGTVRSARDYFIDFALNHDALFIHHGGSNSAYAALKSLKIDHLDGQFDDRAYWRDPVRFNTPGMYEHSSYTNAELILAEAERQGMRLELYEDSDWGWGWGFYPIEALPASSVKAQKITVPFSANYTTIFEYDESTKRYKKFLGESPHIDEETGEQLEVTNILIQFTKMHVIDGDEAGRRSVELVGSGDGYVITGGEYAPVTWKKQTHQSPTHWYDEQGNKLRLNTGKTWICVYKGDVIFE